MLNGWGEYLRKNPMSNRKDFKEFDKYLKKEMDKLRKQMHAEFLGKKEVKSPMNLATTIKELKDWEHSGDEKLGEAIRFILQYVE